MRLYLVVVTLLMSAVACGRNNLATREPVDTSICAIAKSPQDFNHRIVSVNALVVGAGRHPAALVDPRCPDVGLMLAPVKGNVDPSLIALDRMLRTRSQMTNRLDREVSGHFTGKFSLSEGSRGRRMIQLIRVDRITSRERMR
jgi:hypothetical protein